MLKYGVDIFDKNDTRDDELNVRKWMSDRLNRRRVAQTIYIMESRSTLNSTSPSFLTPQYRTQSPFKEYFHRIIENYHRTVHLQAPMTPSESEVQTLLGSSDPWLPRQMRQLRRTEWDKHCMTSLVGESISNLEKIILIDTAIKGSQCLWQLKHLYLDAFSIERDSWFRRDVYIVCVGFNLKFFHLLNLLWTNSSTTPQISHFQLLRGFSFCPTTAVVVV